MTVMTLAQRIYQVVAQIPSGKVSSYGEVAKLAGCHPRQVGYWLHHNETPQTVPCHRVIKSDRTIASGYAFGGPDRQRQILKSEGVSFDNKTGKVDRNCFLTALELDVGQPQTV